MNFEKNKIKIEIKKFKKIKNKFEKIRKFHFSEFKKQQLSYNEQNLTTYNT